MAPFNCTKFIYGCNSRISPHLSCIVASTSHLLFSSPLFFSLLLTQVAHTALNTLFSSFCLKSLPSLYLFQRVRQCRPHTSFVRATFQSSKSPTPELVEARIDCNFQ